METQRLMRSTGENRADSRLPPRRIAYIPGPGDILGTRRYWRRGVHDPRIPVVAYSAMFFDLCKRLDAQALVIQRGDGAPVREGRVEFRFVEQSHSRGGALAYWSALAGFSARAVRETQRFRPDLVILGGDFFWPYAPLLKPRGGRLIVSIHNMFTPLASDPPPMRKRVLQRAHGLVMRGCVDGAIAVSEECRRQFARLAGERVPTRVCRIQCKPEDHARIETRGMRAHERRRPLIAYVGRIERSKGVFDLMDAFESIAAGQESARLVFAGEGGALEALRERIGSSLVCERVWAPGRLDGAGVHALLGEATVLVCPTRLSFREGFPAVCVEALANGLPIIVSTAVPSREMLGSAAIAYEANDPHALAGALEEVLSRPEKRAHMRAAAQRRRSWLYDESQSWGAQLADLIGEVWGLRPVRYEPAAANAA